MTKDPDFRDQCGLMKQMTLAQRFWHKVQKTDSCWYYMGGKNRAGYGQVNYTPVGSSKHTVMVASRFSYMLTFGAIPEGMLVCHHCDNRPCVRPDHLFLGDDGDNCWDAQKKGRRRMRKPDNKSQCRGERIHTAKLTANEVRAIRATYASGIDSMTTLAERYGVTISNISRIISRESWYHLA